MNNAELARDVGFVMKDAIARATQPLMARIDGLERRLAEVVFERGPPGPRGEDGPRGKDGEVNLSVVANALADYIEAHPIRLPQDGRDGRDGKDGKDGRDGKDGKDGSVVLDDEQVEEHVESWLKAHPPAAGKDGADGIDGKAGASGKDADVEDLLPIVEGLMNKAQAELERRMRDWVDKAIDGIPKPKDGKDGRDGIDGKDGSDGFSLENFDVAMNGDGRTLILSFDNGKMKLERSIKIAGVKYREIWQVATAYEVGDLVTYDGSIWAALQDNIDSKPGEYNKVWRLAVKRGRNGKSLEPK